MAVQKVSKPAESFTVKIMSLSGFEFKLTIDDRSDLELAETTIGYVWDKVRANLKQKEHGTNTNPDRSDADT